MIAGGQIRPAAPELSAQSDLEEILIERLLHCLNRPVSPGRPLVIT